MAGFQQAVAHRPSHLADADESDLHAHIPFSKRWRSPRIGAGRLPRQMRRF
jgi:hypothetical protein